MKEKDPEKQRLWKEFDTYRQENYTEDELVFISKYTVGRLWIAFYEKNRKAVK